MLKILLALLIVSLTAALWLLADTLALSSATVGWATVAAIALLLAMVAVELLQRRARRLRDQKRQAERSPFHQTVTNLRSRCEHAGDALRAQNADALPWVLMLGPQGAGKTAALRGSGLGFLEGLGPERFITAGDVAPTESVQFLASDRLVFVDTAGRYLCDTADHDDRREWLELLAILRTQRSQLAERPLAAVVLAVSAAEVAGLSVDEAGQLGLRLRRRLEDIQREFAAAVPVYLLVTRLDEVAGLMRLLADDAAPQGRFGFTVELSGAGASSARRVAEGPLGELALALERRAFARIEHAGTPEERGELYRAPGHFRRLAENVAAAIATLFPDHGQADAPIWRGLYFASAGVSNPGLATPTSADLELRQLAHEYGDPPQRGAGPVAPLARPAFLHGLFAAQLPGDAWIAGWTRKRRGQQRLREGVRAGLLGSAAIAVLSLAIGSARGNHQLLGEASAAIAALKRDDGASRRPLHPAHIAPIQALHHTLKNYREDGPPRALRLGLYQGERLADEVERVYFTAARERLLTPLVNNASSQLTRVHVQHKDSNAALPAEQFWRTVDALHLYLLLTQASKGPITLEDPAQRDWLALHLPRAWTEALALADRDQGEAKVVSERWATALAQRPDDLARRDDALVLGVRQILQRTSRGQMWADELAREQVPGASALTLSTIASAAWLTTKEGRRVEAAYTRAGWDHVRKQVRCPADPADRYLAAALTIDESPCTKERAALHGQYFKRYVEAWTAFINDIYVREPEGYKEIEAQILDMTTPGGPGVNALENLFRVVGDNAHLTQPADDVTETEPEEFLARVVFRVRREVGNKGYDIGGATTAVATNTIATVRDAFKPYYSYGYTPAGAAAGDAAATAPLQAYILLLSKVAHPLGLYEKERSQEGLTQAKTIATQVHELVHNEHFTQRDRHWLPALEGLLDPPVRGLLDAVNRGALDELTTRWCNEVVYPFDTMRPCYPFNKAATCDVSGDEVAGLFQPQTGKLWTLYQDALHTRFPFQGDRYVPAAQGYNSRVKLNPAVATFLTNARELGEVLFPAGSPGPTFSFAVQFKPLETASRITLTVDGVPVTYNNSDRDRFQPVTWPGTGGAPLTRLEAQIQGGTSKVEGAGFWGLFRLLEQGNITRNGRLVIAKLLFNDRVTSAEIRLNPQDGAGNPLFGRVRAMPAEGQAPEVGLMDIFRERRLSPPRQLFTNGLTCRPLNLNSPAPAQP